MTVKIKVVYMGTPEIAIPALQAIGDNEYFDLLAVITQPDKKVGRKQTMTPPPVKEWGLKHNIPVLQPPKLKNNHEFETVIKGLKPDLFVVTAFGQILPSNILAIPKLGSINIHFSILPKYRGASPVEEAILNGDPQTGITIQKMTEKLDAGPIIHLEKMIIDKRDTSETLKTKLGALSGIIIVPILMDYANGILIPIPQSEASATECHKIEKKDGIIDPYTMTAETICRKIRAYDPWPGCYLQLKNKKMKIMTASTDSSLANLQSGDFSITKDKQLILGTLQGALVITKVQMEGKKPMQIQNFLAGNLDLLKKELANPR